MDCKTAALLIPLYVDGECDATEARALEAHVDACADCAGALAAQDRLQRELRQQLPRYTAPAALRARITADVAQARPRHRATSRWLRAAAVFALGVGAGGLGVALRPGAGRDDVARDLLASHLRALAATSPVDVVSSDRHTVKPWFAGKVATAPPVVDLADRGFPLAGARIDYVGDARVGVLVYRHGQHLIDVYLTEGTPAAQTLRGYRIEPIRLGGQPAVAVSDVDAQELARFVAALP